MYTYGCIFDLYIFPVSSNIDNIIAYTEVIYRSYIAMYYDKVLSIFNLI